MSEIIEPTLDDIVPTPRFSTKTLIYLGIGMFIYCVVLTLKEVGKRMDETKFLRDETAFLGEQIAKERERVTELFLKVHGSGSEKASGEV